MTAQSQYDESQVLLTVKDQQELNTDVHYGDGNNMIRIRWSHQVGHGDEIDKVHSAFPVLEE